MPDKIVVTGSPQIFPCVIDPFNVPPMARDLILQLLLGLPLLRNIHRLGEQVGGLKGGNFQIAGSAYVLVELVNLLPGIVPLGVQGLALLRGGLSLIRFNLGVNFFDLVCKLSQSGRVALVGSGKGHNPALIGAAQSSRPLS